MTKSNWDWNPGKKVVADIGEWRKKFEWVEELYANPDGEKVAAVVKTGEMEFSVCENGDPWENVFDKVWHLRYSPDGRLAGLVSEMGEWTVGVDGESWENKYEFVWDLKFGAGGENIIIAAQSGRRYLAVINDVPWEEGFGNIANLTPSEDGSKSAAVVQTTGFNEGDIFTYQKGCYTVAVDGQIWDRSFVSAWDMSFSPDNAHVAAEVRTTLYDYTIAVDGAPWDAVFNCVWKPFFGKDNRVIAPVRIGGGWTLAIDGKPFWGARFPQLWHPMQSQDGRKLAAIVAAKFGRWTIAVDSVPWDVTFGDLVTDAVFGPDGHRIACLGKENEKWHVAVDGVVWDGDFDMAWQPVFSPTGKSVAAKVEKGGRYTILIDGKPLKDDFKMIWDPVFSPDGEKILIRAVEGQGASEEKYIRQILPLKDIL